MIKVYTQIEKGKAWLDKYRGSHPHFACVLGFTETGLIEGISAAGKTPKDRRYTAIADAEFLVKGRQSSYVYPLPPLIEGVSPVYISRGILESLKIPIHLFNAGLPIAPVVPYIDLQGQPAACVSSGKSLPLNVVKSLFQQGLHWGNKLSQNLPNSYLIISECVVGGTTTALSILTGLGIDAMGKINSSHPHCNHQQKEKIVQAGLS
ncbi:MAG: TIGR00303 family protein, partial [Microcystaceae cyanobacterium]